MDSAPFVATCACKQAAGKGSCAQVNIQDLLKDVGVVSPFAARIVEIDDDAADAFPRLSVAIEHDPKLTGRMLGLANSTAFSTGREIDSVRQAVTRLGMELSKATCVAMLLSDGTRGTTGDFDRRAAWLHALLVAVGARSVARLTPLEVTSGSAYSAGLLHDIGYLALAAKAPAQMFCLRAMVTAVPDDRSLEQERACLVATHNTVGATIGTSLGLPSTLVEAILHHHHPLAAPEAARPLATCVAIADRLTGTIEGAANPGFYPLSEQVPESWLALLKIDRSALDLIAEALLADLSAISSLVSSLA
jgi:putative nucleotidyltransferase with HDIG domain